MHTLTWLIWLFAAAIMAGTTSNPLYLVLVLLASALVFSVWREQSELARAYRLFFGAGFVLWLGYLLFSVVTVGGARGQTVLLVLPEWQLPPLLGGITLGGLVTAEDLVWGAVRGGRVWALIAAFGAFNALVDHYRLLRLAPRSLFHAGLAVTIALSFAPQLVRSVGTITEAQRVRGHRFRGPASYLPLVAPLLASSLESSVQLAESLDARGFGRTLPADRAIGRQQLAIIVGVLLLSGGLFGWLFGGANVLAGTTLLAGAGVLLATLQSLGKLVTRTTYRRERWRQRDTITTLVLAIGVFAWVWLLGGAPATVRYNPYPLITAPPLAIPALLALLTLAVPACFLPHNPGVRGQGSGVRNSEF